MILTAISFLCIAPQLGDPDFGWNKPNWEFEVGGPRPDRVLPTPDLTGDGIAEILINYWGDEGRTTSILDGASGDVWILVPAVGPWYIQSEYFEDLDGDGIPEFLLGNGHANSGTSAKLWVFHGGSGTLMWQVGARESGDNLGEEVCFQDVDSDGFTDVLVGSKDNGKIFALKGLTGTPIWSENKKPHRFFSQAPDWNGDGVGDLITAGRGTITALDGASGNPIWNWQYHILYAPTLWENRFTDINGDGIDDVVLIHPKGDYNNQANNGLLEARDGLTGDLLWARIGFKGQFLGSNLHVEDYNGDGVDDFLSHANSQVTLINGADGGSPWQRALDFGITNDSTPYLQDLTGDGHADFIYSGLPSSGTGYALEVWDGATGITHWRADTHNQGITFGDLYYSDFNLDGRTDVLTHDGEAMLNGQRVGVVRVLDGVDGNEIWKVDGTLDTWLHGRLLVSAVDPVPGPDVLMNINSHGGGHSRIALNGITGHQIWRHSYEIDDENAIEWHELDMDGDGDMEILERQDEAPFSDDEIKLVLFRQSDGALIWSANLYTQDYPQIVSGLGDVNGDGADEFIITYGNWDVGDMVTSYSSKDLGWIPGITASSTRLSAGTGGKIEIEFDLPTSQTGWSFQILLSETGSGPSTINGLLVPLSNGYWLSSSYLGIYPDGMFSNALGVLDDEGDASATIFALPGDISSSAVGITMYMAVVSAEPGNAWEFSSDSVGIEIIP